MSNIITLPGSKNGPRTATVTVFLSPKPYDVGKELIYVDGVAAGRTTTYGSLLNSLSLSLLSLRLLTPINRFLHGVHQVYTFKFHG